MSYQSLLQTTLTIWTPGSPDGFGGMSFSAPTTILGRIQEDNNNHLDAAGEEFISASVCYTLIQLEHNMWVYEGTSVVANPQNQNDAYRVRKLYTTKTPSANLTIFKSVLG